MEVPATIGGTLESCLLDDADDRCIRSEDDMDSESAILESLIR